MIENRDFEKLIKQYDHKVCNQMLGLAAALICILKLTRKVIPQM